MLDEPHFIDSHPTKAVERIVLLTGKMYYHLVKERAPRPAAAQKKVAFIRIEKLVLFPLPAPQEHTCALRWKPRPRGALSASINATTHAFITADNALFDFACTVSSGVHSAQPLLDLTTLEENDIPYLTIAVMPLTGTVPHASRSGEIFCLAGKGRSQ